MGTMVRHQRFQNPLLLIHVPLSNRVINAELRQPKSDRGQAALFIQSLNVTVSVVTLSDRQNFNTTLAATLTQSLRMMLTHTSSERGRSAVPLITDASGISPFPIEITVTIGGIEVD